MRNRKPLTRSAQVIAFLNSRALEDEQAFVNKKTRSSAMKKSKAKPAESKKSKAINLNLS